MRRAARHWLVTGLAPVALSWCVACGSSVKRGTALYAGGHYVEAAEVFERTELKVDEAPASERAAYGLYRGLTFLKLDDLRRAEAWLRFGASTEQASPGSLTEQERRTLETAWLELGQRIQHSARAPDTSAVPFTAARDKPR
jgi:hypothetical protein